MDSDGNRVNVGNFDAKGLNVNNYWDDNRNDYLGVASARNFYFSCEPRNALLLEGVSFNALWLI